MNVGQKKSILYKIFPKEINLFYYVNLNVNFQKTIVQKAPDVPVFTHHKRESLWDYCLEQIGESPIDYLEFGVFDGYSIDYWRKKNKHQKSRFFGFDTFRGLPEDWKKSVSAGHFDMMGDAPKINDNRVSFVAGLFQETLPKFLVDYEPISQLVIHIDSDLYSSSLFVLTKLDEIMKPGTIILFDEFEFKGEFASFYDYVRSYYRNYQILARTQNWGKIVLKITE